MKAKYTTSQSATHFSIAVGLALLGSASLATADNLNVNTFDADISGIAWENWRSYVIGHDKIWDAAQDADTNANSGAMYVTVNWPLASDPNWNNGWNDVQVAFGAGTFASADYIDVEAYVKVADGELVHRRGRSMGSLAQMSTAAVVVGNRCRATPIWRRPPAGSASTVHCQGFPPRPIQRRSRLISNGGSSLTNTAHTSIDNVRLTYSPSVHTDRPALNIAGRISAALLPFGWALGDAWQRQMVRNGEQQLLLHTAMRFQAPRPFDQRRGFSRSRAKRL
ncbi:MAG: hypothetical protein U1F83_14390 [Verrucomicrobiota bacterium]